MAVCVCVCLYVCVCVCLCVYLCICVFVYVCVCMCVCICVYVCVCVCMCVCVYVCEFVYACVYMYVCVYMCICVCVCVCLYVCVYMCMNVCVYVCVCVCIYMCMYVYVCMCAKLATRAEAMAESEELKGNIPQMQQVHWLGNELREVETKKCWCFRSKGDTDRRREASGQPCEVISAKRWRRECVRESLLGHLADISGARHYIPPPTHHFVMFLWVTVALSSTYQCQFAFFHVCVYIYVPCVYLLCVHDVYTWVNTCICVHACMWRGTHMACTVELLYLSLPFSILLLWDGASHWIGIIN